MTLTGEEVLVGFSKFIGDYWQSTTTSAGTTSTLIDTALSRWGNNAIVDRFFRRVVSGEIRRAVIPFTQSNGEVTVLPVFSTTVSSGLTYQMHRYDPVEKWRALDAARLAILPWVFKEVRDDTLTGDGRSDEFTLPTSVEWGPEAAMIEQPLPPDASWNLIDGDNARTVTAGAWSASGSIAESDYTTAAHDKVVPRLQSSAVKLVYTDGGSDGTYTLPVSAMRAGVTAAGVAGRHVELGLMVYSEVSGLLARIITDVGTLVSSSAHQGRGWEFLTCEGDVDQTNATTFSARLVFPTGGSTKVAFLEEAYLVLGNLPSRFIETMASEVEYDATTRRIFFREIPPRGHHIRLVGKAPITALGESTPAIGSMEIDEKSAMILYAEAAEILFGQEILNQPAQRDVLARIATVKDKRKDYQKTWRYRMRRGRVISPFSY